MIVDLAFRATSVGSRPDAGDATRQRALSEEMRSHATAALRALGFEIVGPASEFGVTVSGSDDLVRRVFGSTEAPTIPEPLSTWIASARVPPPGQFLGGDR